MPHLSRYLFLIHETNTDTFCTSARFTNFGKFEDASIFLQRKNAQNAINGMNRWEYLRWGTHLKQYLVRPYPGDGPVSDLEILVPNFEIMQCTLSTLPAHD